MQAGGYTDDFGIDDTRIYWRMRSVSSGCTPVASGCGFRSHGPEIGESGSWKEVSQAHRDMLAMKIGATGQSHRFGVGNGRFKESVEIGGVSGIGDALVGAQRW